MGEGPPARAHPPQGPAHTQGLSRSLGAPGWGLGRIGGPWVFSSSWQHPGQDPAWWKSQRRKTASGREHQKQEARHLDSDATDSRWRRLGLLCRPGPSTPAQNCTEQNPNTMNLQMKTQQTPSGRLAVAAPVSLTEFTYHRTCFRDSLWENLHNL